TGNGVFVPAADDGRGITGIGTEPSSFDALTADALAYSDSVEVASTAAYAIGDFVVLKSGATLPNTGDGAFNPFNLTRRQCFRVEGKTATILYLDGALEYDYLTTDSASIGICANARRDIYIENFNWG